MLPRAVEVFIGAGIRAFAAEIDLQLRREVGVGHGLRVEEYIRQMIHGLVVQAYDEIRVVQSLRKLRIARQVSLNSEIK